VHCRWREWEGKWEKLKLNVGETDSPEPVTVCLSRVLTAWNPDDGWVMLKGDGQPVTECDGRHREA